jgi:pyridoxine kinase
MDETGLLSPRRLLTGYIPNAAALQVIKNLAHKLKSDNPYLIYLLDRKFLETSPPSIFIYNLNTAVLGDSGKLYVSQDVIPMYKDMLSFATIITPNWFEVESAHFLILS